MAIELIDRRGQYEQAGRDWYTRLQNTIKVITVHHSADWQDEATDEKVLQNIYNAHKNNGWVGTSYHIIYIPKSRNFYWINDFSKVTWHDAVNWDSIGVLIHGYYHPGNNGESAEVPTVETLADMKQLLDWLCTENPQFPADQNDVYGHRERSATACPGNTLFPYVTEYRTKNGNVNWGDENPTDWRDKFLFDVTKRLEKDIFEGLNLHKADGFPRETALDSIYEIWNGKNVDLVKAIGKANEFEGKYKTEVEDHKKTKTAFTDGLKKAQEKYDNVVNLLAPKFGMTREEFLQMIQSGEIPDVSETQEALNIANEKIRRLINQEYEVLESLDFLIKSIQRKYGIKKTDTTN